jgi:hypothetical protein
MELDDAADHHAAAKGLIEKKRDALGNVVTRPGKTVNLEWCG